jgi:pyrroline-5-carboxylate reductase
MEIDQQVKIHQAIGFIGSGQMAEALIGGLLTSKTSTVD